MSEILLIPKKVGEISGKFFVPSYQRGYRWGEDEVWRLLDDIYSIQKDENSAAKNYCLQPIVVRNNGDCFELIDGQQRLTTIYLIYKYLFESTGGSFFEEPQFSLEYKTRDKSEEFLKTIDTSLKDDNIDFWFMANAYETIDKWFGLQEKKSVAMGKINTFLADKVKVIWYEIGENEDAISLFTRLNIGKIPLTSAELVKAMFLSRDGDEQMDKEKQEEIALQWDNIEKELHHDGLWYFLTNSISHSYQTRIDLILDLISGKEEKTREKYYTFFEFDKKCKEIGSKKLWESILHTFLILKDWYYDHDLYHKIGYLIASNSKSLSEIYKASENQTKKNFKAILEEFIRESIRIKENYGDLRYDKSGDYGRISRLLLLFNVESVRKAGEGTQWFPFDKYKYHDKGKVSWSLEHIHAQQSQGMKTEAEWRLWIELHLEAIKSLGKGHDDLIAEMQEVLDAPKVGDKKFDQIQQKVISVLSAKGNGEYLHSLSNLALLNMADNAALNNSTFDVKRNQIVKMDKEGFFIPYCTRMVFLKYYTPSELNQLHFWGEADRKAYVNEINEVLGDYLDQKIDFENMAEQEVE